MRRYELEKDWTCAVWDGCVGFPSMFVFESKVFGGGSEEWAEEGFGFWFLV